MAAVPVVLTGVDQALYTPAPNSNGVGTLFGWSIRESNAVAAVATVLIRSGVDATGPIVATIELAANGSTTEWFGPQGVQMRNGIFVDIVAGTVEGSVYIG